MSHQEVFGDPVVIPGPNIRSLFTDTETVDGDTAELVAAAETHSCPRCRRDFPVSTLSCPDDGTTIMDLPSVDPT